MTGNPTLLDGAQILAREITVDRPTARGVKEAAATSDTTPGVQVLAALTVAELRRITGSAAFPMTGALPATFLTAR